VSRFTAGTVRGHYRIPVIVRVLPARYVGRQTGRSSLAEVTGLVRRVVRCCTTCPAGIISTAAYDVNVPFMQLERNARNLRKPCLAFFGGFLLVRALHRGRDGTAERRG
jgi:hypothetical protein